MLLIFMGYWMGRSFERQKGITITNTFQKFQRSLIANQTKYGLTKVASFTIDQWNYVYKIMIKRCIQHITKENLLLLKDLLEP